MKLLSLPLEDRGETKSYLLVINGRKIFIFLTLVVNVEHGCHCWFAMEGCLDGNAVMSTILSTSRYIDRHLECDRLSWVKHGRCHCAQAAREGESGNRLRSKLSDLPKLVLVRVKLYTTASPGKPVLETASTSSSRS